MKKSLYIYLLFLVLFRTETTSAQQPLIVKFGYTDTTKKKGYYFPVIQLNHDFNRPTENLIPLSEDSFSKADTMYTSCVYNIRDTAVSLIGDGYGHLSITIPGDTMEIIFKRLETTNGKWLLNGKFQSVYFNNFDYRGKNRYIHSLFDSIAYHTGQLFMVSPLHLQDAELNLNKFFDKTTAVYNQRITYLNDYSRAHHIPNNIRKLVATEIKSSYIDNLLDPLSNIVKDFQLNDYSKNYLDSLNNYEYDNASLFNHTIVYYSNLYRYINVYKSNLTSTSIKTNSAFKRTYNYISKNIHNVDMREELLLEHLYLNIKAGYPAYDTLYRQFKINFPKSKKIASLDSLYTLEKSRLKVTIEQALSAELTDSTGKKLQLKDLIKGKPLLIDCWASWCIPCLKQMPYSRTLEQKYGKSVDFIYLSYDKK